MVHLFTWSHALWAHLKNLRPALKLLAHVCLGCVQIYFCLFHGRGKKRLLHQGAWFKGVVPSIPFERQVYSHLWKIAIRQERTFLCRGNGSTKPTSWWVSMLCTCHWRHIFLKITIKYCTTGLNQVFASQLHNHFLLPRNSNAPTMPLKRSSF